MSKEQPKPEQSKQDQAAAEQERPTKALEEDDEFEEFQNDGELHPAEALLLRCLQSGVTKHNFIFDLQADKQLNCSGRVGPGNRRPNQSAVVGGRLGRHKQHR